MSEFAQLGPGGNAQMVPFGDSGRAALAGSAGGTLDKMARAVGLGRIPGESDDGLRKRIGIQSSIRLSALGMPRASGSIEFRAAMATLRDVKGDELDWIGVDVHLARPRRSEGRGEPMMGDDMFREALAKVLSGQTPSRLDTADKLTAFCSLVYAQPEWRTRFSFAIVERAVAEMGPEKEFAFPVNFLVLEERAMRSFLGRSCAPVTDKEVTPEDFAPSAIIAVLDGGMVHVREPSGMLRLYEFTWQRRRPAPGEWGSSVLERLAPLMRQLQALEDSAYLGADVLSPEEVDASVKRYEERCASYAAVHDVAIKGTISTPRGEAKNCECYTFSSDGDSWTFQISDFATAIEAVKVYEEAPRSVRRSDDLYRWICDRLEFVWKRASKDGKTDIEIAAVNVGRAHGAAVAPDVTTQIVINQPAPGTPEHERIKRTLEAMKYDSAQKPMRIDHASIPDHSPIPIGLPVTVRGATVGHVVRTVDDGRIEIRIDGGWKKIADGGEFVGISIGYLVDGETGAVDECSRTAEVVNRIPPLEFTKLKPMPTLAGDVAGGTSYAIRAAILSVPGVQEVIEVRTVEAGLVGVTVLARADVLLAAKNAAQGACAAGMRVALRNTYGEKPIDLCAEMNTRRAKMIVAANERAKRLPVQTEADADVDNFGDAP